MALTRSLLLVDDDEDLRTVLQQLLSDEGFHVHTARDGLEALTVLREIEPPGLILLDLMMPVMNGWRFREEQTRDRRLAGIPVIAMSALAEVSAPPNPRPLAFVSKPFNVDKLLARIAERVRPS
jgi:CheY-like chemotaxis protein